MSFRIAMIRCGSLVTGNQKTQLVFAAPFGSATWVQLAGTPSAQKAHFASGADHGRKWYNPMSYMSTDQESQFLKQMEDLNAEPVWNVGVYNKQLIETTKSTRVKLTAKLLGSQEVEEAKKSQRISGSIIKVVGHNTTGEALTGLGRIELLKIANEAEITVATLEEEIQKISSWSQVHRLVRFLKSKGKDLPKSSTEMQHAMQIYAPKLLTKQEKKALEKQMKANMENQRRS